MNVKHLVVSAISVLVADILVVDLSKVADPGELVIVNKSIEVHLGGHAANISRVLRKLSLPEGSVSVIGAVGDDLFATYIVESLKRNGIRVTPVRDTASKQLGKMNRVIRYEIKDLRPGVTDPNDTARPQPKPSVFAFNKSFEKLKRESANKNN